MRKQFEIFINHSNKSNEKEQVVYRKIIFISQFYKNLSMFMIKY